MFPRAVLSATILGTTTGLLAVGAPSASAQVSSIRLGADRKVLQADGKSNTFIVAQVFNEQGGNVPDGTRVVFTLTSGQGRLESGVVETRGSVARVRFTAGDAVGAAVITANLEPPLRATPDQITITFTLEATAADTGINFAHFEGKDYLGYAADKLTLQANGKNGGAVVSYRGVSVRADLLQFDALNNEVLAQGNVVLRRGDREARFNNLRYSLVGENGFGERDVEGRLRAVTIEGTSLKETDAPLAKSEAWEPRDLSDSAALVKARAVDVEIGTRMQFRRATIYIDGSRTVSLPFHVINLNGQNPNFTEQLVGYNAGGVTVDVPIYYDVRPSAIGTMHVRHGAPVGATAFSNRTGWSVDFDQSYRSGGGAQANGLFQVFGLTRQNWGARFTHNQQLASNMSGSLFIDFPNHKDLFGSSQISRRFNGFSVNLSAVGSYRNNTDSMTRRTTNNSDLRWQLDADTFARALPGSKNLVRYSLNLALARQNFFGTDTNARGQATTQTAGIQMYTPSFNIGRRATLSQSANVGQTWISGGASSQSSGASILATTTLSQRWGDISYGRLTYNFAQTPLSSLGNSGIGRHRLGLEADIGNGMSWGINLYGSRSLDINQSGIAATLRLNPGYVKGPWRTSVRFYRSQAGGFTFSETEFALVRRFFNRDIGLLYSTTARQFQIDLNAARF